MTDYMLVIIGLCITSLVQCFLYHLERRELYDRIMSGDLTEYRRKEAPKRKTAADAHRQMIDEWRSPKKE